MPCFFVNLETYLIEKLSLLNGINVFPSFYSKKVRGALVNLARYFETTPRLNNLLRKNFTQFFIMAYVLEFMDMLGMTFALIRLIYNSS